MAEENVNSDIVVKEENVKQIFPYKILNELSAKLKSAEAQILLDRQFYEAKINEYEAKLEGYRRQSELGCKCKCQPQQLCNWSELEG